MAGCHGHRHGAGADLGCCARSGGANLVSTPMTIWGWPFPILFARMPKVSNGWMPRSPAWGGGRSRLLRQEWRGELGIHTHDNMGLALPNTLRAHAEGVEWLDATVTGMGRGPGNARTEELAIEVAALRQAAPNLVPLMTLIRKHFGPM